MGTANEAEQQAFFRGKAAIVTGAGSGIGYAVALALGRAGAAVGLHYRRNRKGVEELGGLIRQAGGQAEPLQADLSRPDEAARMFEQFDAVASGRLDLLVNNAGEWMDKAPILDCPLEQWEHMFAVNARSVFLCCREAARRMVSRGAGAIVNLGSVAGHTGGGGGTVPYAAAKAAVHTFTRGLARELAPAGIRVNAVAPGMVDTPMLEGRVAGDMMDRLIATTPLGRLAEPREVASAVLFLLSPAGSFITGEILEVNGGLFMR
jgi:3-oxoacyl-[acyl-carrier protein] reductase